MWKMWKLILYQTRLLIYTFSYLHIITLSSSSTSAISSVTISPVISSIPPVISSIMISPVPSITYVALATYKIWIQISLC
jgi:hypothetical protein